MNEFSESLENPDVNSLKEHGEYHFTEDTIIPFLPSECRIVCEGNLTIHNTGGMVQIIGKKNVHVNGYEHGSLSTIDAKGDIIFSSDIPADIDALSSEGNIVVNSGSYKKAKLSTKTGSIIITGSLSNANDLILEAPNGAVVSKRGDIECKTLNALGVHLEKGNLYCQEGNVGTKGVSINDGYIQERTKLTVQSGDIDIKNGQIGNRCHIELGSGTISAEKVNSEAHVIAREGNVHIALSTETGSITSAPQAKVDVPGRVKSGSAIKARDGISAGVIEKNAWCESCKDVDGRAESGAFVKANQTEIKDYFGRPNPLAMLRARRHRTPEQVYLG